ncbi:MAG: Lrp/AsnC family transcriptional regulator [Alphaproteobacteria bacterium]|nr:Lrp/AsnC family transcriptional regulator [Alphaproteobacteria bacterium]
MNADDLDARILAEIADGLPLAAAPYAAVGARIGVAEADVIARLKAMIERGVIRRFGAVVRHHELGFTANAMTVWDVPDAQVDGLGERIAAFPFVTLCYQRPRRLPDWPYNLFCMIHGRGRAEVMAQIEALNRETGAGACRHEVLFSLRRFKQRGARYRHAPKKAAE